MKPQVGTRVVLRFRRPAGSVPSQSDALGILESLTPAVTVRDAAGGLTTVDPADVVVLKSIPPRPVRTAGIRELERAAAFADPAAETAWVHGWVARAGGDDLRSSAVPLADPSMPEGGYFHDLLGEPTLRALADWYEARGLPLRLRLPDRLARPPKSWPVFEERLVLAAGRPDSGQGRSGLEWSGLVLDDPALDRDEAAARISALLLATVGRAGGGRAYVEAPEGGEAEAAARDLGFADHHRVRHVRLRLNPPPPA